MVQFVGRLTALGVQRTKRPGMYCDGAGLYLQVTGDGAERVAKSWIYRYHLRGRAREMGLGSVATYSLAEARASDPRRGEVAQLQGVHRTLHRRARRRLAQRQARRAMGQHAEVLRRAQ